MQEQHLVVGGDAHQFAQVGFGLGLDAHVLLAPVRHFHHRHATTAPVDEFLACLFEHFLREGGGAGAEVEKCVPWGDVILSCGDESQEERKRKNAVQGSWANSCRAPGRRGRPLRAWLAKKGKTITVLRWRFAGFGSGQVDLQIVDETRRAEAAGGEHDERLSPPVGGWRSDCRRMAT